MPNIGDIEKRPVGRRNHRWFMWLPCLDCKTERWVRIIGDGPQTLFCRTCVRKHQHKIGEANPNWRGGRIVRPDGYIEIYLPPDSPYYSMVKLRRNRITQYVLEHRLVMAQHLGRYLKPWEIIHHKGIKYPQGSKENRGDNRLENLELYPKQVEHWAITKLEAYHEMSKV